MGISGHVLGPRKLRRLNRLTDMDFDRAYNRNGEIQARKLVEGVCVHFEVDAEDWGVLPIPEVDLFGHWSSCFADRGEWVYVGQQVAERVSNDIRHMVPIFESRSLVTSSRTGPAKP